MKKYLFLLVIALVACGGEDGENNNSPKKTIADGIDIPGVIVLIEREENTTNRSFGLLDPRTNTTSPVLYPLDSQPDQFRLPIDVSPDGGKIAHINPAGVLFITRIIAEGDQPNIESIWDLPIGDRKVVGWNRYGDRVYTEKHWVNAETGEFFRCQDMGLNNRITPMADGYHYRCGSELYQDGVFVTQLNDEWVGVIDNLELTQLPTADGQLATGVWGINPVSLRLNDVFQPDQLAIPSQPFQARFDGREWLSQGVTHGKYKGVEEGNVGGPNPVNVCVTVTSDRKATESVLINSVEFNQTLDQTSHMRTGYWDIADALEPYYGGEDSQVMTAIGVHPETEEVVYNVAWRTLGGTASCENPVTQQFTVIIGRDGTTRETDDHLPIPGMMEYPWNQQASAGYRLNDYGNGDFIAPIVPATGSVTTSSTSLLGTAGYIGGKPVTVRGSAMSANGASLVNERYEDDEFRYCETRLPSLNVTCMPQLNGGTPVLIAGEGVMPSDTVTRPYVRALSQTARPVGSTLTIFGVGFGNAGSLKVGDVTIPSTDTTLWTDKRIEVVVTDAWPDKGVLQVESGGRVSGEEGLRRWVAKTTKMVSPLDVIPQRIELRQGLNRVDLGGIDAATGPNQGVGPDGIHTIFSEGVDEIFENWTPFRFEGYLKLVNVVTFNEVVDSGSWEPRAGAGSESDLILYRGFEYIGGELFDADQRLRPRVDSRVLFDRVFTSPPNAPNPFGLPEHWRQIGDQTFSRDAVFRNQPTFIDGWEDVGGQLRAITRPIENLQGGVLDFGGIDQLVVATRSNMGLNPGYNLSTDGGATWGDLQETGALPTLPAGVQTANGPAVLVWVADGLPPTPKLITATEYLDIDITQNVSPPAATRILTSGPVVIYHQLQTQPVMVNVMDANPTLDELDLPGDVFTLTHDEPANKLYAVLEDGTVHEADFNGNTPVFTQVDLDVEFSEGTTMQIRAVAKLPDGRWVARGNVPDGTYWTEFQSFYATQ